MRSGSTYAALERTTIDVVTVELANGHGSVLVGVHFDKGKTSVGLEARLGYVAKVLEERNQVRLRCVRRQIADVARGLPLRSLCDDHVIALNTMRREMVMAEWGSRRHAHRGHSLLLGDGGLSLLVSPVASNGSRPKPLSVHGAECAVSIRAIAEGNETVSTRPARLHVPHNASFRNGTEGGKSLQKDLVIDLIGQVADEDVEVVRCVFLCRVVGLVRPIDADFLNSSDPWTWQDCC